MIGYRLWAVSTSAELPICVWALPPIDSTVMWSTPTVADAVIEASHCTLVYRYCRILGLRPLASRISEQCAFAHFAPVGVKAYP